jgi:hypothetical protein
MAVMDRPAPFGRKEPFTHPRNRAFPPPSFGRTPPAAGDAPDPDASSSARPRDRLRDLSALALLAIAVFLVAALATFNPADPPAARVFPPNAKAANACGLIGSTIASGLYQLFGLGGWFVVGMLGTFVGALLRRRPLPDLPLRAVGAIVATAGICTLLAMYLADWVPRPLWGAGGYVGAEKRRFLYYLT